jgi:Glycosyltransferase family 87
VAKGLRGVVWVIAALTVSVVVYRGLVPPGHVDSKPLVLAGLCWLQGLSPYRLDQYDAVWREALREQRPPPFVFAYPPTAALLVIPLAAFGLQAGELMLDVLNLVALVVVLVACITLMSRQLGQSPADTRIALATLLGTALIGAISHTLVLGQTGLVILAATAALWVLPKTSCWRGTRVFCVVLLTMKPTLTLPVLSFLLVVDTRTVLLASAAAVLVTLVPTALSGSGAGIVVEWMRSLNDYGSTEANQPAALVGLNHLLSRMGYALPYGVLSACGSLGGLLIGLRSSKRNSSVMTLDDLVACLVLTLAFERLHGYDTVLGTPIAFSLAAMRRRWLVWCAPAVVLLGRPNPLANCLSWLLPGTVALNNLEMSVASVALLVAVAVAFVRSTEASPLMVCHLR